MEPSNIRIARRLVTYMLERAEQAHKLSKPGTVQYEKDMGFFMGLGMGLAIVFEEVTGRSAAPMKPQELMQWAKDLPSVPYPKVVEN